MLSDCTRNKVTMAGVSLAVIACGAWLVCHYVLRPRVSVHDMEINRVVPGSTIDRVMRVENVGRWPLTINDIKLCCGVSLPEGFRRTISPGGIAYIPIEIRLPFSYGNYDRTIFLATDDSISPLTKCVIHCTPDMSIRVDPHEVNLEYVIPGQQIMDACSICALGSFKSPPNVVTSSRWITASVRKGALKDCYNIDIEMAKDAPRGKCDEYMYVKTGIKDHPNVVVPIHGVVERGIRIRPQHVLFSGADNKGTSRTLYLEVLDPQWSVMNIGPYDKRLMKVNVCPINAKKWKMDVVRVSDKSENTKGDATVELRNRAGESVVVPVIVWGGGHIPMAK